MFKRYSELCDVVSLIVYCPAEKSFLLNKEYSGEYWLPSCKSEKGCWKYTAHKLNFELFGLDVGPLCSPLRVSKFWLPDNTVPSVHHVIYKVTVKPDIKKKTKIKNTKYKLQWVTSVDLERHRLHLALRSPEVMLYASMAAGDHLKETELQDMETGMLVEVCEENAVVGPGAVGGAGGAVAAAGSVYELVQAANYTREDQIRFYREFVMMAFPAMYISQHIFSAFMMDLGWHRNQCSNLFRAADASGRGGLALRELVAWAAALEPDTAHNGASADARCRYIFRYFDSNRDLKLEYAEFKELVAASRHGRQLPIDALSVSKDADSCLRALGLAPSSPLQLSEFLRAVAELRLRGTSTLLRTGASIAAYLYDLHERDREVSTATVSKTSSPQTSATIPYAVVNSQPRPPVASKWGEPEYSVASYTVCLHRRAPDEMLELANFDQDTVSLSTTQLLTVSSSEDRLSPTSLPAETLSNIRYFSIPIEKAAVRKRASVASMSSALPVKQAFAWSSPTEEIAFGAALMKLADSTRPMFEAEPRLLRLDAPVYAIGDLHGNLQALLAIEAALWPSGAALCPSKLLFLGDYVDRGLYGAELMAYLLAIKLQRPRGVFLLRGNHETRDIQKMFTFYTECLGKYGETEGNKIWNAINSVFDVLPLAAVVDKKIFCCHGGIPPPWICPLISGIDKIPIPLPKPAEQSSIAWELLWNDPIKQSKVTSSMAMELSANEGFAANGRRGTGHVFEQAALDRFLGANQLSHVVRAHEMHPAGFMCQLRGRLVSVFSSAHYCGGSNDAALALIDHGKLRLMRITHL